MGCFVSHDGLVSEYLKNYWRSDFTQPSSNESVVHHLSLDQNFRPAPDRWSHKLRTYSAFEFKDVSLLKFLEMVGTIGLSLSPAAYFLVSRSTARARKDRRSICPAHPLNPGTSPCRSHIRKCQDQYRYLASISPPIAPL